MDHSDKTELPEAHVANPSTGERILKPVYRLKAGLAVLAPWLMATAGILVTAFALKGFEARHVEILISLGDTPPVTDVSIPAALPSSSACTIFPSRAFDDIVEAQDLGGNHWRFFHQRAVNVTSVTDVNDLLVDGLDGDVPEGEPLWLDVYNCTLAVGKCECLATLHFHPYANGVDTARVPNVPYFE